MKEYSNINKFMKQRAGIVLMCANYLGNKFGINYLFNYLLVRRFENYVGNSLNRYLDVLNIVRECLEENGDGSEELERRISEVVEAIKRNDVMTQGKVIDSRWVELGGD